jgi:hypothetical protein
MCVNGGFVDTPCASIGLATCRSAGSDAKCQ